MRLLPLLGIVLCALALAACTSMRPLDTLDPASLRAQLAPGDEVEVTTKDGASCEGTVRAVDEHVLSVNRTDAPHAGETIEVPYDELATVASRRPDTGRTVFAAMGSTAVVIFVILSVAILIAFA